MMKYDMIILDLNMPVMDGFTACKSILGLFKDENCFNYSDVPQRESQRPVMVALSSHISK